MSEEFVPYKEALSLKELGFDDTCFMMYNGTQLEESVNVKTFKLHPLDYNNFDGLPDCISAPTYQQVFRWFREKYQLHSTITSISQESWQWHITKPGESLGKLYNEDFYDYEEAELACLKKLIEIVKENKEDE
jgi:hypothetical protein